MGNTHISNNRPSLTTPECPRAWWTKGSLWFLRNGGRFETLNLRCSYWTVMTGPSRPPLIQHCKTPCDIFTGHSPSFAAVFKVLSENPTTNGLISRVFLPKTVPFPWFFSFAVWENPTCATTPTTHSWDLEEPGSSTHSWASWQLVIHPTDQPLTSNGIPKNKPLFGDGLLLALPLWLISNVIVQSVWWLLLITHDLSLG